MNIDLKGKRALVCGSTQGIGKATALRLAACGASVTLAARNEDSLQLVFSELEANDEQAHSFICADFDSSDVLIHKVTDFVNENSPIHILVNNTGGPAPGPVLDAVPEEYIEGFKRHLINNHNLAKALIPGMKAVSYGRIINIISTSVKQPIPDLGVSNTIRGAVASWAKTLAAEVGRFGITVNNILPGFTDTARLRSLIKNIAEKKGQSIAEVTQAMEDSVPAGRFADPNETAAAVVFLAATQAAYINGINLPVDGGRTQSL